MDMQQPRNVRDPKKTHGDPMLRLLSKEEEKVKGRSSNFDVQLNAMASPSVICGQSLNALKDLCPVSTNVDVANGTDQLVLSHGRHKRQEKTRSLIETLGSILAGQQAFANCILQTLVSKLHIGDFGSIACCRNSEDKFDEICTRQTRLPSFCFTTDILFSRILVSLDLGPLSILFYSLPQFSCPFGMESRCFLASQNPSEGTTRKHVVHLMIIHDLVLIICTQKNKVTTAKLPNQAFVFISVLSSGDLRCESKIGHFRKQQLSIDLDFKRSFLTSVAKWFIGFQVAFNGFNCGFRSSSSWNHNLSPRLHWLPVPWFLFMASSDHILSLVGHNRVFLSFEFEEFEEFVPLHRIHPGHPAMAHWASSYLHMLQLGGTEAAEV